MVRPIIEKDLRNNEGMKHQFSADRYRTRAFKQDRLFMVRSIHERSVTSHVRPERLPNDCPQISVLLLGDRAERFDQVI